MTTHQVEHLLLAVMLPLVEVKVHQLPTQLFMVVKVARAVAQVAIQI
jgi:hypothetical protein